MSTLQDLRETLGQHADGVQDTGRHDRAAAVRRRVRVARRRRTAVTAVAAALVMVGGVGAVGLFQAPREPQVADHTVVGVAVPEEVTILGFPYELSGEDRTFGKEGRLEIGGAAEPRAISLVADGLGSGSATLFVDGVAVSRVFADDPVAVPVAVPVYDIGEPVVSVQLHDAPADVRTGVAIYEATGELAPGVANEDRDMVFRSVVGSDRLRTAVFSEDDDSHVRIRFDGDLHTTQISAVCRTDEQGLWMRTEVDGEPRLWAPCGPTDDADVGRRGGYRLGTDGPSGPHTVEAVVTRGQDGPVVEDADVELGIAAYELGDAVEIGGLEVDTAIEHGGRTWRLDPGLSGMSTGPDAVAAVEADTDLLLGFVAGPGVVRAEWEGALTIGATDQLDLSGPGPGTLVDGLLLRGDTYDVRLVSEGELVSGALLVYRPE